MQNYTNDLPLQNGIKMKLEKIYVRLHGIYLSWNLLVHLFWEMLARIQIEVMAESWRKNKILISISFFILISTVIGVKIEPCLDPNYPLVNCSML